MTLVELMRTNEPALLSFVEATLRASGLSYFVADAHMSAVEGSIGAFPRRILVDPEIEEAARRLLADAGVGAELKPKK